MASPLIEREPSPRIMWRAYRVGISADNKLVLAGAHNKVWEEVDFVATCNEQASGQAAQTDMRARITQSKVFMPGELRRGSADPNAARRAAYKRCIMHLETASCHCGVWGYKAPARLQHDNYLNSRFWNNLRNGTDLEILCAVRAFGTVLEGTLGYRASETFVEAMFVPIAESAYVSLDPNTMRPKIDVYCPVARITIEPQTAYSGMPKRLDPDAIWARLQKDYACQVIPVANGIRQILELDKIHPDPIVKPLGWTPDPEPDPLGWISKFNKGDE